MVRNCQIKYVTVVGFNGYSTLSVEPGHLFPHFVLVSCKHHPIDTSYSSHNVTNHQPSANGQPRAFNVLTSPPTRRNATNYPRPHKKGEAFTNETSSKPYLEIRAHVFIRTLTLSIIAH